MMLTYTIYGSLAGHGLTEGPAQLCKLSTFEAACIGNGCCGQDIPQLLLKVAQLGKGPSQVAQNLRTAAHKPLQMLFCLTMRGK